MRYNKDINELEKNAVMWWPDSLKSKTSKLSAIPILLDSQDEFTSILRLSKDSPFQVFDVVEASKFSGNLFLKHLTVLADYGGETIQRLNENFHSVFNCTEEEKPFMEAVFEGKPFRYEFQSLPIKGTLSNKKLGIDGGSIGTPAPMTPLLKDMAMILLYGASAINAQGADIEKCEIGAFLGKSKELDKYLRQKYIWVSRITGGATANTQGQLAQTVVCDYLKETLGDDYSVKRNGTIVLDDYGKATGMPFDVVVEKNGKYVGIEISFQVTTNSTIERKAGQAQDRYNLMHAMGHHITYVLDGAGNFQRRSAISTICEFSDCTVAYSESEFAALASFIKEKL